MIDAHVHLFKDDESNAIFFEDNKRELLQKYMDNLAYEMKQQKIDKYLLYILDQDWYYKSYLELDMPQNSILGVIVSPFWKDIDEKLDALLNKNIKIVKILPYEQGILREQYSEILKLAKKIEERNMVLTICCSYGSKHVFDTNGVELTGYLLNNGIKSPLIMAHGGMVKVFEAMSLMLEYDNLFMDISFTLSYWWKSSVIEDYAFVMNKLNYNRIFYGSDYPYVDLNYSYDIFKEFCLLYEINDDDKQKILCENFKNFILNYNII